jgi:hypothetical protein
MPEALERHQKWLLASGILAILAGIVAIAVPAAASVAIDLFIGWLLLFSSAFALVDVFAPPRSAGRVAVRLVCAALFLAAGVYLAASRPPRTPWPEASEIVNRTRPCATAICGLSPREGDPVRVVYRSRLPVEVIADTSSGTQRGARAPGPDCQSDTDRAR